MCVCVCERGLGNRIPDQSMECLLLVNRLIKYLSKSTLIEDMFRDLVWVYFINCQNTEIESAQKGQDPKGVNTQASIATKTARSQALNELAKMM